MNPADRPYARFLRNILLVLLLSAGTTIAFVAVVDPYGIYGLVQLAGFNAVKPGLSRYQTEIKEEHALHRKPRLVILGNSRAEIGFDPQSLSPKDGPGYNLAIAGTGVSTSARQLEHLALAGAKPQTVIMGVEFIDFLQSARPPPAAAAPAPEHGPHFWRFDALFSLTSLKDAMHTLRIQHVREASTITAEGFNPLKEYLMYAREDGYNKIFRQRAQESAAALRKKSTTSLAQGDFTSLQILLSTAVDMDADIKLIIYPYHAQMLALFEAAGLWPLFEDWKGRLVQEVAAARKAHPSAKIELVDFSGFGPYNCERIPGANERSVATLWYWEAGHFKKELGDLVLRRILSPGSADAAFGILLDTATQKTNAERIAFERATCAASQPDLFAPARFTAR